MTQEEMTADRTAQIKMQLTKAMAGKKLSREEAIRVMTGVLITFFPDLGSGVPEVEVDSERPDGVITLSLKFEGKEP